MKKFWRITTAMMSACLGFSLFAACDSGKTYSVTYADGVDGTEISVPVDTTLYKAGDTVTVKEKITRYGYVFKGWADGENTYRAGSTFAMPARNVTLTAKWGDPVADPGTEEVELELAGRTIDATLFRPDAVRFPIVIFSHGYNGHKNNFKSTAQMLAKNGIGAITFTFCGSGKDNSGLPTTDMTLFTEKEDLLAVIDYAKTLEWFDGNLYLLGGSQGGMVTAMAAEDRADEIRGMILLYPAFCIPDIWNEMYPDDDTVPESIDWWGVALGRNFVLSLRNLDVYEKMPQFSKPVLLLHGTADDIVPIGYSQRAAGTYPNAELITYPGEGHGFTAATTKDMEARLLEFIK